ncbi:DNA utilization protein HofM [Salmonella enterica subsp. diarizonae]|uniref:DNA utilization protein HofM n=1 Tax=Salmonella diarizonae TaxID=59204 RepID=A0A379TSG2_SALDZ|nr:DNA utilization protein HofM [Salmonella enterica subsp. diarizonae]
MAFKTWQIGLHIQQHEALAIAVVRGASGWSLQRWWRLPLMNASTAEGTIPDPQSLAHVLRSWSRELPLRHRIHLSFPANRTLQRAFPHPPMRLREREQVAWLAQTMGRELDMEPDLLRFDFQDDALSPAFNVTRRTKQRHFSAVNAGANAQCAYRRRDARCLRVTALTAVYTLGAAMSGLAR